MMHWIFSLTIAMALALANAAGTLHVSRVKRDKSDQPFFEITSDGGDDSESVSDDVSSSETFRVPTECKQASVCATSFEELQNALLGASSGETVGLCNDIQVDSTPISIRTPGIILVGCCTENKCVIQGTGNTRNLVVSGGDFALHNVAVRDGKCTSSSDGGGANLSFRSESGSLEVKNCDFANGQCDNAGAGNVDVSTLGAVTFENSSFRNGSTNQGWSGGGAFVYRSQHILVDNCEFEGNEGIGIGMYGDNQDLSYLAVIRDSKFSFNEGGTAGGIFYSDFGRMQRLEILNTEFSSNTSTDSSFSSGAAQVSQGIQSGPATFLWQNNFGTGNCGLCSDASHNGECFAVDETFSPSSRNPP